MFWKHGRLEIRIQAHLRQLFYLCSCNWFNLPYQAHMLFGYFFTKFQPMMRNPLSHVNCLTGLPRTCLTQRQACKHRQ